MNDENTLVSIDLVLRVLVIVTATQLAFAWIQSFQTPWPLENAFELAHSFEEQLFWSLGISLQGIQSAIAAALVSLEHADALVRCAVELVMQRGNTRILARPEHTSAYLFRRIGGKANGNTASGGNRRRRRDRLKIDTA